MKTSNQAGFTFNWVSDIEQQLPFSQVYGELLVLLFLNTVLGIGVGIVEGFYYEHQPAPSDLK